MRTEQEASGSEGGPGRVGAGFVGSLTLLWARRHRRKEQNRTEKKSNKNVRAESTHTHAHTHHVAWSDMPWRVIVAHSLHNCVNNGIYVGAENISNKYVTKSELYFTFECL